MAGWTPVVGRRTYTFFSIENVFEGSPPLITFIVHPSNDSDISGGYTGFFLGEGKSSVHNHALTGGLGTCSPRIILTFITSETASGGF